MEEQESDGFRNGRKTDSQKQSTCDERIINSRESANGISVPMPDGGIMINIKCEQKMRTEKAKPAELRKNKSSLSLEKTKAR